MVQIVIDLMSQWKTAKIHPLCQAFPALTETEYDELKESIRANGQLEPIVVNSKGLVLDGRHRYRACCELQITPVIMSIEEFCKVNRHESIPSDEQFIFDRNFNRRSLTPAQRMLVALDFLGKITMTNELKKRVSKFQKGQSGNPTGKPKEQVNPKCGSPSEPRDLTKMHAQSTIGQIAAIGGGSRRQATYAVAVDKDPEVRTQVMNGQLTLKQGNDLVSQKTNEKESQPLVKGKTLRSSQNQNNESTKKQFERTWPKYWQNILSNLPPQFAAVIHELAQDAILSDLEKFNC